MNNKELWAAAEEILGAEALNKRFRRWIRGIIKAGEGRKVSRDAQFEADVARILQDLNERTGARYRVCPPTLRLIRDRLKEEYTVEDFIKVHAAQVARWKDNPEMRDYLRPSTLYRHSHFHEYLQNWNKDQKEETDLRDKRASASRRVQAAANDAAALAATTTAKLAAVPWHEFESFSEWFRHTTKFPDAKGLAGYLEECPPELVAMRKKLSFVTILTKGAPDAVEVEFAELRGTR